MNQRQSRSGLFIRFGLGYVILWIRLEMQLCEYVKAHWKEPGPGQVPWTEPKEAPEAELVRRIYRKGFRVMVGILLQLWMCE